MTREEELSRVTKALLKIGEGVGTMEHRVKGCTDDIERGYHDVNTADWLDALVDECRNVLQMAEELRGRVRRTH
jgi:hypothetical protein